MKRGRGNKALTVSDIHDIRTMNAKGFYIKHLARLYDVNEQTVFKYMKVYPPIEQKVNAIPKGRPWERNWHQRVIWATP